MLDYTRISGNILTVIGCWPLHYYDLPKPKVQIYRIYMWYMYLCLCLMTFGEMNFLRINLDDFSTVSKTVSDILGVSMVQCKIVLLFFKRRHLYRLLKEMQIVENAMVETQEKSSVQKLDRSSAKEARFVTLAMLALIGATISSYNIKTIYFFITKPTAYLLPYPFAAPYDHRTPVSHPITLALELCAGVVCICIFCAVDSLYACLAIFASCQFEILKISISKSINASENQAQMLDPDTQNIKLCIQHHQAIYKFCVMLEEMYSPIVMVQVIFSGVTLSFVAFALTQSTSNMGNVFTYLSFFCLIGGSLFVYCWYGQKLTNESMSVTQCLYMNTKWYERSKEYRTILLFMIFRSQRLVYISAMGFVNATLESFTAVLKTAVSYFALLNTLGGEEIET